TAREDEPSGLPARGVDTARIEPRAVRACGAAPNRDRVRVRAELVHEPPALLSADPAPPGQRDAAVERDRHLVGHEGPLPDHPGPPRLVQHARVEPVDELDVDTCIAETFFAACRFRIRVARAE